jgi:hypothetical protein
MEHQNCCTDLRHPELLAACCPYSSVHGKLVVQHPSRTKKVGKLPPLRSFSFLTYGVCFVMEDRDLAVALPQLNIVKKYDSESTVATTRQMRPAIPAKDRPREGGF